MGYRERMDVKRRSTKLLTIFISFIVLVVIAFSQIQQTAYAASWSTIPSGTLPPSGILLKFGTPTKVTWNTPNHKQSGDIFYLKGNDAQSYSNPLSLEFSNCGKIDGRSLNAKVDVTSVKYYSPYGSVLPSDGYLPLAHCYGDQINFGPADSKEAQVRHTITTRITITYADNGAVVNLPFCHGISDIDAGGSNSHYKEGITFNSGYASTFYIWPQNECNRTSNSMHTKSGAATTTGNDIWYKTGCLAPTANGQFTCTWEEGNSATGLSIYSTYLNIQNPTKTVTPAKAQAGDTITWTVKHTTDKFYVTAYNAYSSYQLKDTLPAGVKYVSAKVTNGAGADITHNSSWGTLSWSESSRVLTYSFAASKLADKSFYNGQTFTMTITTTAENPTDAKKTVTNNVSAIIDGLTYTSSNVSTVISRPVLEIQKNANADMYHVGDTVYYTVDVTQTTSDCIGKNVVVTDTIPSGLVPIGSPTISGVSGTVSIEGNTWTAKFPELEYNETAHIQFKAHAKMSLANKTVTNTANATVDYGTAKSASKTVEILHPNLTVDKSVNKHQFYVGTTAKYSIKVNQTQEKAIARNVVVRDSMKIKGITIQRENIAVADSDGTDITEQCIVQMEDDNFTVTIPKVEYNKPVTVTYDAYIDDPNNTLAGTTVENIAAVSADNFFETDDTHKFVTDTEEIEILTPVITLKKTADREWYNVGDTITYTITATETAAAARAADFVITDTLPSGLELVPESLNVSGQAEGVVTKTSTDGNSFRVELSTLEYGHPTTVSVKAKVVDRELVGKKVTNAAIAEWSNSGDDPNVQARATSPILKPAVTINKVADKEKYNVGDTVEYTVTATETVENARANDFVLKDTLPDGLELDQDSIKVEGADADSYTINKAGNRFNVEFDKLEYGHPVKVKMKAKIVDPKLTGTKVKNTAFASWSNNGGDPDVEGSSTIPVLKPSVEIAKEANNEFYNVGDEITYTITATETEPDARANDFVISDELPSGLELNADSIEASGQDGAYDVETKGNSFEIKFKSLTYGSPITVTFKAKIVDDLAGQEIKNTAIGEWTNNGGEPPAEGSETSPVLKPNVTVQKVADKEFYNVGDTVTYTITATQTVENARANNFLITDTVPSGLTIDTESIKASGMNDGNSAEVSTDGQKISVQFKSLSYGEEVTITFKAKIVSDDFAGKDLANTAIGKWTNNGGDPDAEDTVEKPVLKPAVTVEKVSDKDFYNVGDTVTYTVTATETKENARANNFVLSDKLPSGLELIPDSLTVSDESAEKATEDNSFTVTVPTLEYGEPITVTVKAKVADNDLAGKEIENVAVGKWSNNGGDPEAEGKDTSPIMKPIIDVQKRADKERYNVGDTIKYTITATQTEENAIANDVVIADAIPNGLTLDKDSVVASSTNEDNVPNVSVEDDLINVTMKTLSYGETVTITFNAEITDSALTGRIVKNLAVGQASNNGGEPSKEGRADTPIYEPQVTVEKKADKAIHNVGDIITYTITATQTVEGARANDFVIRDTLPDGLELVPDSIETSVESTVKADENSFSAALGNLEYNSPVTVTLKAKIVDNELAGKTIHNVAIGSWSNDHKETTGDIETSVYTPIIGLEKVADKDFYNVGENITWDIIATQTVENATAYDVVISDTIPKGLILNSESIKVDGLAEGETADISVEDDNVTVKVPDIAYGDTITITLSAKIDDAGLAGMNIDNLAVASWANNNDEPDVEAHSISPVLQPKLSIDKNIVDKKARYRVGDMIPYDITVKQITKDATASKVVIDDTLENTITLNKDSIKVSGAEDYKVTVSGNKFTVEIPILAYGDTVHITYKATANTADISAQNIATATCIEKVLKAVDTEATPIKAITPQTGQGIFIQIMIAILVAIAGILLGALCFRRKL